MGNHLPGRAPRRSRIAALAAGLLAAGVAVPLLAPAAAAADPVTGAIFTTTEDGSAVNGNIYDAKGDVYLNGGPNAPEAKRLAEGDYFFAVLAPGGQSDPNDGSADLLSEDLAVDRTFHANPDGTVEPLGSSTHFFSAAGGVQLIPYLDTPNPGGEYIVAVCRYEDDGNGGAVAVSAQSCKYDAFKVRESATCTIDVDCPEPPLLPPTGAKTATPTHEKDILWTIDKTASRSGLIQQLTAVTVNYSVVVTKTVESETWSVAGTITVSNGNTVDLPVTVQDTGLLDVTDTGALAICEVDAPAGGTAFGDGSATGTVPAKDDLAFPYSCIVEDPGTVAYRNRATIAYTDSDNSAQVVTINSGSFDFTQVTLLGDPEAVTVTDTTITTGSPGSGSLISDSQTFTYSRTLSNPGCRTYDNTAALSTGPSDTVYLTLCGPSSGGLTMGWWQNSNGQALLKANLTTACARVTTFTGTAATAPGALINASSSKTGTFVPASCTGPSATSNKSYLPTFTYNVVKAANASGTGTPMLLGQWLTTVLDTVTYPSYTSAGRPTLDSTLKVVVPANVAAALAVPTCTSVESLLSGAVTRYGLYATNTSAGKATVTALATVFDNLNNNRAQTCP